MAFGLWLFACPRRPRFLMWRKKRKRNKSALKLASLAKLRGSLFVSAFTNQLLSRFSFLRSRHQAVTVSAISLHFTLLHASDFYKMTDVTNAESVPSEPQARRIVYCGSEPHRNSIRLVAHAKMISKSAAFPQRYFPPSLQAHQKQLCD